MKTGETTGVDTMRAYERMPWGKYSLLVKLNMAIGISFVLTMAVFLFLSYRAERSFQLDHTVRLLHSTVEVMAAGFTGGDPPKADQIRILQERLDAAGVHHHMVFVVDPSGRIIGSAAQSQSGEKLSDLFPRSDGGRMPPGGALVSDGSAWWLRVDKALPNGNVLHLFLHWGHVASNLRTFWALHGVHVLVTLVVFSLLLWFVMERFVRRRLVSLLKAIRRMEMGRWDSDPEELSRDEFGWLHERFREMGQRLKENVDRLVRGEKYASAAIIVLRVAREMNGPLASIRSDIQSLSSDADLTDGAAAIIADLDRGVRDIERCLGKLTKIKHPSEWEV